MNDIGKKIKIGRIESEMDQKELAKKAGVSYVTISNIETGRYGTKITTLNRIAEALGKELHIIFK